MLLSITSRMCVICNKKPMVRLKLFLNFKLLKEKRLVKNVFVHFYEKVFRSFLFNPSLLLHFNPYFS